MRKLNKVILSSVVDIISGGTPKTSVSEYWNGEIGWLTVNDFNDDCRYVYSSEKKITQKVVIESNTKLLDKGDIIISARGTVGALAQIGIPMCFNQSCFGLKGKRGILDTDFLYYALRNYVYNIKKRSQGSVFDTINLKSFDLMEIEIPKKIEEQKRIASVLSALDAKIELNNRINRELEAMAKTLYDYWFVQFDFPITREQAMAMGKPELAGKPYKRSGGPMVYHPVLKREIPEGWEVKELGEITSLISRGISPKYVEKGGVCVLNQKCVRNRTVLFGESRRNDNAKGNADSKKLQKFDILVNSTGVGTLGRVAIVSYLPEDIVTVDSHVTIVRADNKLISLLYLGFSLLEKQIEIERFSNGSTGQVELSRAQLEGLKILIPADSLQSQFAGMYKNCLDKMAICSKENQQLASLRDWLLPMLMNGQVRVKEAGEMVPGLGLEAEVETGCGM